MDIGHGANLFKGLMTENSAIAEDGLKEVAINFGDFFVHRVESGRVMKQGELAPLGSFVRGGDGIFEHVAIHSVYGGGGGLESEAQEVAIDLLQERATHAEDEVGSRPAEAGEVVENAAERVEVDAIAPEKLDLGKRHL